MSLTEIFKESKELKRFIYQRTLEYKIPLRYLCQESGIRYDKFMDQYINVVGVSRIEVTDEMVERLLSVLGMSVRFQFIVDEGVDMESVSGNLALKYQVRADKIRVSKHENKRNSSGPGQGHDNAEQDEW